MDPKDYITLSDITIADGDTVTLSNHPWSNTGASVSASSYPYTITAGTGLYTTGTNASPWYNTTSSKIRLDGEGADIEVNGVSLMDMIERIEQRLNILHPNEKLEEEWAELRALGEQYRKLEKHIQEKQATWDRLKAMPSPNID
jgi:hypothetical protein